MTMHYIINLIGAAGAPVFYYCALAILCRVLRMTSRGRWSWRDMRHVWLYTTRAIFLTAFAWRWPPRHPPLNLNAAIHYVLLLLAAPCLIFLVLSFFAQLFDVLRFGHEREDGYWMVTHCVLAWGVANAGLVLYRVQLRHGIGETHDLDH